VNVLWVYLDRVDNFTNQLTWDDFLREEVIAGEDGIGPYAHFPNYKTVDDDGFGTLTQLTARQVNLLANLTWWVVNENAATFSKFIGATT
jgi:hypothetical protein